MNNGLFRGFAFFLFMVGFAVGSPAVSAISAPVQDYKITLVTGTVLDGPVIAKTEKTITIKDSVLGVFEVARTNIAKIEPPLEEKAVPTAADGQPASKHKITLVTGTVLDGPVVAKTEKTITINDPVLGVFEVARTNIATIEPPLEEKPVPAAAAGQSVSKHKITLVTGTILDGPVVAKTEKAVTIDDPVLGVFEIARKNIAEIEPPLEVAPVPAAEKPAPDPGPVSLKDAVLNGLIELEIDGGEQTVEVKVIRKAEDDPLRILLPEGLTTFGIIENNTIKTGGMGATTHFTEGASVLTIHASVRTNAFQGDGFRLNMTRETVIVLEKSETQKTVSVEGKLDINVPFGFTGFFLSGLVGTIVEGKIIIERTKDEEGEFFLIRYGNMKVSKF